MTKTMRKTRRTSTRMRRSWRRRKVLWLEFNFFHAFGRYWELCGFLLTVRFCLQEINVQENKMFQFSLVEHNFFFVRNSNDYCSVKTLALLQCLAFSNCHLILVHRINILIIDNCIWFCSSSMLWCKSVVTHLGCFSQIQTTGLICT